ncbi:MAG: ATP-dependent DNA ligase, partial [Actinomycetota bacterium]|nr:ATP-dependent DNA ligase [Actinomycetota bacterium]
LEALPTGAFVMDGEIVVATAAGFDFAALLGRLHPAASRVALLRRETPASFIAFDLLALGDADLRERPFHERRAALAHLLADARPPLFLTPATDDRRTAEEWLERFQGAGIDGVVAKPRDLRYESGKRSMVKVKRERTVDCVVAGMRPVPGEPRVASLLLGLYSAAGVLHHVGVSSSFAAAVRAELFQDLHPLAVPLAGHPWEHGYLVGGGATGRLAGSAGRWTPDMEMDWVPLRPDRVCEVAYDQVDGERFRYPARFVRWRPDRDPESCRLDQLAADAVELAEILPIR